jgi:hypothetical protein
MSQTELQPWWEASEPHEDVRSGELPESVFAIDLGAVINNNAPPVYQNPVDFFEKTHITQVLEDLIKTVIDNVGGEPSGNRIQRLQTGFGGGKTHLLLALYHLLNSPEEVEGIEKILPIIEDSAVGTVPDSEVAVIVGTDLDTSGGRKVDDLHIRTPWGELAYQLGGEDAYEILETSDQERTAPGKDKIVQVFQEVGPSVILVDELLQYALKAKAVEIGQSTLAEQTVSFIDELSKAVGTIDDVFAVLSLQASERYEMFGDAEAAEQMLNQIESKIERVDTVTRPIQKSEVYNIARQRIFDKIAEDEEREQIAEVYHDYYRDNSSEFPDRASEPGYKDRLVDSYPFHPEFIDTLYEQWGSMPDFQRTRGVLRFLAKVVSDQYQEQNDTPLIQCGQLNMGDEAVRDEILDYLEEGWDSVISSDIAGDDSKSAQIDRQMGGIYHSKRVTQSLAASLFLFSQGGGQQRGATLERLRFGVLQPGMDTPLIADAISRCEDTFFYLYEEDRFYRFTKTPNLNRVVAEYETNVEDEDKVREIREALDEVIGGSSFDIHIWPSESGDVPDDHDLRLAILHPEQPMDAGATDTMGQVEEIWENYNEEFREYRNSIVFLAADAGSVSDILSAATTKAALREIKANQSLMNDLSESQMDNLEQRSENAEKNLPSEIRNVYREAAVPRDSDLKRISFDASILSSDKSIDGLLEQDMKQKDLLLSSLDPNLISSDYWDIWPKEDSGDKKAHLNTFQLWEHFGKLTQLPMLESEKVLKECIAKGVDEEGILGYAGYSEEDGYQDICFQETFNAADVDISEDAVIIRESKARQLIQQEEEEKTESVEETDEEEPDARENEEDETEDTDIEDFGSDEDEDSDEESESGGPSTGVSSIEIKAKPNWENQWDDTYQAAIEPLARLGADITIEVTVDASSEEGLDRSDIERQVEEHLTQQNIDFNIRYKDS